eukprot:1783079-Pleurochrysis_carterae.AAC.3
MTTHQRNAGPRVEDIAVAASPSGACAATAPRLLTDAVAAALRPPRRLDAMSVSFRSQYCN